MKPAPILPGATIGIIGGGQLGQMSAMAAIALGYRVHIFSPEKECPAAAIAHHFICSAYDNIQALDAFASSVDVITFEFENIPQHTLKNLALKCPTYPHPDILHLAQNRLREKAYAKRIDIPTAAHQEVTSASTCQKAFETLGGTKAILKTQELGYDGKGQILLTPEDNPEAIWQESGFKHAVMEAYVPFVTEISAIIARNASGQTSLFPIGENTHQQGILHQTIVPACVSDAVKKQAETYAVRMAEELDLRGILALEFFVLEEGTLLFNEMAPRPHNSGHWSQDGCVTSQFEQHIRAVCNIPLGDVTQHSKVRMHNLLGNEVEQTAALLEDPRAKLHLYGKKTIRPGRKMGHVNYVTPL